MVSIPKPDKYPFQHISYRPISLLNQAGKILNQAGNNRLLSLKENNNKANPRQHGFTRKKGTGTATGILYELIATALANKNKVNLVLRDINKAFDKIWHAGLKFKLLVHGYPRFLVRIISNYLHNRKARIRIGNFTGYSFPFFSSSRRSSTRRLPFSITF